MKDLINEATYQQMEIALPASLEFAEDVFRLGDGDEMSGYGNW